MVLRGLNYVYRVEWVVALVVLYWTTGVVVVAVDLTVFVVVGLVALVVVGT